MANLAVLSAVIEDKLASLDREEGELKHENTDVTDVMNWIAGFRQRARLAKNVKTIEIAPV